ncbi:MAG: acyltransferase, partial [Gallionellaceae bacterium]|nr:acyltransferase [Gallionellaceae bacterium]
LISYPLYLWHWPILSFLRIVEPEAPSAGVRVTAVALSLALAWLTYRLVERPVRFGRKTWVKTAVLTMLMVVAGYVGFTTYQKEGLPERHEKFLSMPEQIGKALRLGQRPDEAKVMLLGDSHAEHLVGALMELGNQVADYTGLGCIPFYNVDRYDYRFPPGACRARVNASLELFERSETLNTIILASMGPVYLTGETFMGMDEARVTGLAVTISNHPELTDRWKIYETGMRETLDRLLAKNKKVIFVLDVPELGFQPRTCIDNRPLRIIGKAARKPCAVSREAFENRAGRYRRLVTDVLKDYPQVELYDPVKVMCDEKWCWAMKDGLMLYRDFDHLSLDGGKYIGQTLNPLVRKTANLK